MPYKLIPIPRRGTKAAWQPEVRSLGVKGTVRTEAAFVFNRALDNPSGRGPASPGAATPACAPCPSPQGSTAEWGGSLDSRAADRRYPSRSPPAARIAEELDPCWVPSLGADSLQGCRSLSTVGTERWFDRDGA